MTDLAQAFAGWSLAVTMAAVAAALVLRTGRRRTAINEALHELRRPLQALALSEPSPGGGVVETSTRLAAAALGRLDRAVNGGTVAIVSGPVRCETVLRAVVGRWRARVFLGGGSLELRWRAGEATVDGDRVGLEQAIDNLVVNAIEHGGPAIVVEGRRRGASLVVSVIDSGRDSGRRPRRERPGAIDRLSGRRRHGHGLAVVRGVAAEHGGRFVLRHSAGGSVATLELPLTATAVADRAA